MAKCCQPLTVAHVRHRARGLPPVDAIAYALIYSAADRDVVAYDLPYALTVTVAYTIAYALSNDAFFLITLAAGDCANGGGPGSSAEPCLTEWDGFIIRTSESIQNGAEFIDAQNKISDEVKLQM